MNDDELSRIDANPGILGGKPVIKGTRISVEHVLNLLTNGMNNDDVLIEYPGLEIADVRACLIFAHRLSKNEN